MPANPSARSVIRLYKAWPRWVRDCLLNPAQWARNGIIHEPTNQKEATHNSITCHYKGRLLIDTIPSPVVN